PEGTLRNLVSRQYFTGHWIGMEEGHAKMKAYLKEHFPGAIEEKKVGIRETTFRPIRDYPTCAQILRKEFSRDGLRHIGEPFLPEIDQEKLESLREEVEGLLAELRNLALTATPESRVARLTG